MGMHLLQGEEEGNYIGAAAAAAADVRSGELCPAAVRSFILINEFVNKIPSIKQQMILVGHEQYASQIWLEISQIS
jgi:hypothetical protein